MTIKKLYDVAAQVIRHSIKKSDKEGHNYLLLYELINQWEVIVGGTIAEMTRVHSISKSRTLILKLRNPSYALEANMYKDIIKQRINTHLGMAQISVVTIVG